MIGEPFGRSAWGRLVGWSFSCGPTSSGCSRRSMKMVKRSRPPLMRSAPSRSALNSLPRSRSSTARLSERDSVFVPFASLLTWRCEGRWRFMRGTFICACRLSPVEKVVAVGRLVAVDYWVVFAPPLFPYPSQRVAESISRCVLGIVRLTH